MNAEEKKSVVVETAEPRAEDVGSIDGMIRAFYGVISGPVGQAREWSRDRTLYVPGIQFTSLTVRDGKPVMVVRNHQQYVDSVNDYLVKNGFFENEIHRVTTRYGNVVHVWSTYESRSTKDGPVFARGVNSIDLLFDGKRWWISSASWEDERPDNPIPKEFLPE